MKILKFIASLFNSKGSKAKQAKSRPAKAKPTVTKLKAEEREIESQLVGTTPILSLDVELSLDQTEGSVLDKPEYKELIENNRRLRELHRLQYERNVKGIEAAKGGDYAEAIRYFEENIAENFDGSCPYDRLIEIYIKLNRINDAIRVTQHAIKTFENVSPNRGDSKPKLNRYRGKLDELLSGVSKDK